jgi:hypothetical protein
VGCVLGRTPGRGLTISTYTKDAGTPWPRGPILSVSLVQGFVHHPDAWKNGEIAFFAHAPNLPGGGG